MNIHQVNESSETVAVICVDCQKPFYAVRESDCHIYQRCTRCCDEFDRLWRTLKRDS